jgi:hypothetical protein
LRNQAEMDFDKWYRSKIESQPEPPPVELWDAIQDDLDVEAVWTRLRPGLAPARVRPLYLRPLFQRLAVAASLLLLVALGGLYFLGNGSGEDTMLADETTVEPPVQQGRERPVEPQAAIPPTAGTEGLANARTRQFAETATEQPGTEGIGTPGGIAHTGGLPAPGGIPSPELIPAPSRPLLAAIPQAHYPGQLLPIPRTDFLAAATSPSDRKKSFSEAFVGASGQFANTWLLNNKTINGLKSTDLTTTQASFGQNIGLRAGTNLGERSWLRLEWHFLSQSRQRYDEYINGQYVSTSMNLDYQNLSVAWHFRPGKAGSPHQLGAGLYAGLLRNATQEVNGYTLNVAGDFTKLDYGILAGYEFFHRLRPGLTLSTGVYGKVGLNNVFAGNEFVPPYLNHTQNAALMLSFALNYDIW